MPSVRTLLLVVATSATADEVCVDRTLVRSAQAAFGSPGGSRVVALDVGSALAADETVVAATLRAAVRGDFGSAGAAATASAGNATVGCDGGGVSQCNAWHACGGAALDGPSAAVEATVALTDAVDWDYCDGGTVAEADVEVEFVARSCGPAPSRAPTPRRSPAPSPAATRAPTCAARSEGSATRSSAVSRVGGASSAATASVAAPPRAAGASAAVLRAYARGDFGGGAAPGNVTVGGAVVGSCDGGEASQCASWRPCALHDGGNLDVAAAAGGVDATLRVGAGVSFDYCDGGAVAEFRIFVDYGVPSCDDAAMDAADDDDESRAVDLGRFPARVGVALLALAGAGFAAAGGALARAWRAQARRLRGESGGGALIGDPGETRL